jgi:serine protease inhibitor
MDRNTLEKAMSHISSQHITTAAKAKRHKPRWIAITAAATAAAILALVLLHSLLPQSPQPQPEYRILANEVQLAATPRVHPRPSRQDYAEPADFQAALDNWLTELDAQRALKNGALSNLNTFFSDSSAIFLSGDGNQLWSPVNAYMGLAMLTELTAGESRQQILELLGADDMDALREQTAAIFESAYHSSGNDISKLANSLWLQDGLSCNSDVLDALSYYYYVSTYSGELSSDETGQAITDWLDENTGGLLKDYPPEQLDPKTFAALYSTIYFQSQWVDAFSDIKTFPDTFHGPSGDQMVPYMRKSESAAYYWGNHFSAVALPLSNGGAMWFILPDTGFTPQNILDDGQYMEMVLSPSWENCERSIINLSIPKFDVSGKESLVDGLRQLGVNDIFSPDDANFSIFTNEAMYVDFFNQAVRVKIDEKGVTGTAYTEIGLPMSGPPPENIVDFLVDRPFLFVVEKDNIPLFTGVVNEP